MNINKNITSIEQITGQYLNNPSKSPVSKVQSNISFQEILKQKELTKQTDISLLKFSKHAGERLADRNISLTAEQLQRLHDGAKKAGEKGINESLVVVDNMAFIVNIKNNVVVTAIGQQEANGNIFTNIDGAVII